ncbi:MAG: DUF5939 domain-containing protein [Bdellovibrionota bacterium]
MEITYDWFASKFKLDTFGETYGVKPLHFVWKFSLKITPGELWPYIADTSKFNRYIGMAPRNEREENGKMVVTSTLLGVKQEWVEDPWTWVREKSVQSIRFYNHGIATAVRSMFILEPTISGVDLYINFTWIPKNAFSRWFLYVTEDIVHNKFKKAFAVIESHVNRNQDQKTDALKKTNDPQTNVNLPELEKATAELRKLPLVPAIVDQLVEFIKTGDDADLYRIRVIELGRKWGIPKKDLLRTCMYGVRTGLLTMTWDVICPHCRGVRQAADSLGQIVATQECVVCEVDFETDKLESIEVVFHVHPTFRKVNEVLFCAAEPSKKEHIVIQQKMKPGATLELTPLLKEGPHKIRIQGLSKHFEFEAQMTEPLKELVWGMDNTPVKVACNTNPVLKLENKSKQDQMVSVHQCWWKDDALHPADIFSIQEFQDVFSKESLNPNVKISLGVQVLMFTDIVGSTSFYTRKGDAAAFAEVKLHFQDINDVLKNHNGILIKTIGDSVMASFGSPDDAFKASLAIQGKFSPEREDTAVQVRISLHMGQVIIVHLASGLDLFGSTVNKTAKLQVHAGAGQIAVSPELYRACDSEILHRWKDHVTLQHSASALGELPLTAYVFDTFKKSEQKEIKESA